MVDTVATRTRPGGGPGAAWRRCAGGPPAGATAPARTPAPAPPHAPSAAPVTGEIRIDDGHGRRPGRPAPRGCASWLAGAGLHVKRLHELARLADAGARTRASPTRCWRRWHSRSAAPRSRPTPRRRACSAPPSTSRRRSSRCRSSRCGHSCMALARHARELAPLARPRDRGRARRRRDAPRPAHRQRSRGGAASTSCATRSTTASRRRRPAPRLGKAAGRHAPHRGGGGRRPGPSDDRRRRRAASTPAASSRRPSRRAASTSAAAPRSARDEALRLLFLPGFSTRDEVTEVSGRGIGLDAVGAAVARARRRSSRSTRTPAAAPRSYVEVPVARRGDEVMLVRVGAVRLGAPGRRGATGRRGCARTTSSSADGRPLAPLGDRLVPFVPLATPAAARTRPRGPAPAARASVAGLPLAVAGRRGRGRRRCWCGPGRPRARRRRPDRRRGAARLRRADRGPGPAGAGSRRGRPPGRRRRAARARARRLRILLVDDSLVTREMERRLLEDAGFDVTAAADGGEALAALADAALRLPGHRRRDARAWTATSSPGTCAPYRPSPSCRSSWSRPATARRTVCAACEAGADAYLTKQSLDAAELVSLVRRLAGGVMADAPIGVLIVDDSADRTRGAAPSRRRVIRHAGRAARRQTEPQGVEATLRLAPGRDPDGPRDAGPGRVCRDRADHGGCARPRSS